MCASIVRNLTATMILSVLLATPHAFACMVGDSVCEEGQVFAADLIKRTLAQLAAEAALIAPYASQVQYADSYMQGINLGAAFVNDVKSLSANYLEDNNSISSIPRNYQALVDRHLSWLSDLSAKFDAGKSAVANITDVTSYQASVGSITTFADNCQSDMPLVTAENRFVSDLATIKVAIGALQQRGAKLSSQFGSYSGIGSPTLPADITSADDALSQYAKQIEGVRQQVLTQAPARAAVCNQIPKAWRAAADAKLRQLNVARADQLIASIDADLRGPKVYAMVAAATSNALYSIDYALTSQYAPIHGQRSLYKAQALLPNLRRTIAQASIGDSFRTAATAVVDQFQHDLQSRVGSVSVAMGRQAALAAERQRLAKLLLARNTTIYTADCKALANTIVLAPDPESVDAESSYIKFLTNCEHR